MVGSVERGARDLCQPELIHADRDEIFWIPRDMEAQMQPKLAEAARLMLDDLDGHEGYGRWFEGGSNPPDLPSRSGYYLGYLLAKQADRGDVAALARMPPDEVRREAR